MKKNRIFNRFGMAALFAIAALMTVFTVSCSDDHNEIIIPEPDPVPEPSEVSNPAAYITDTAKLSMLRSMKDIDGEGRLYEIDYTADYKLDQALALGLGNTQEMFAFVAGALFDKVPSRAANLNYNPGCSAFAVPEAQSINFLMGRNYDFRHTDSTAARGKYYVPISAILVHTAPKGGKRSISLVDGVTLGKSYSQGFYSDGETDLSTLMGLPYAALDGINEDGFAIGVLALTEMSTQQNAPGKKKITTTVAIRMLLDKASTVKQAIEMLKQYNMDMSGQGKYNNYHYFMADATGDYAIVEYTTPKGDSIPRTMEVFTANDTTRCVTNFYVAPSMAGTTDGWGSNHGKARYETMRNALLAKRYTLKEDDAMALLRAVSQPPTEEYTSQTQWSSLYNLTERTLRLCILRDYAKEYKFRVGQVGQIKE